MAMGKQEPRAGGGTTTISLHNLILHFVLIVLINIFVLVLVIVVIVGVRIVVVWLAGRFPFTVPPRVTWGTVGVCLFVWVLMMVGE